MACQCFFQTFKETKLMNIVRYVNIAFVAAGLLAWVVMADVYVALFDWFAPTQNYDLLGSDFMTSDLLGLVTGIVVATILWTHNGIRKWGTDVATELSHVTWPGFNETRQSTFVVIVVSIVVSLILGLFDYVWAWLTKLIYGV
jgi:preprotein translocase SecE subunit